MYDWTCQVCEKSNAAGNAICDRCACPAAIGPDSDIDNRIVAFRRGISYDELVRPHIQDKNDFDARVSEGDVSKFPYFVVGAATMALSVLAALSSGKPALASGIVFGLGFFVMHAMNLYWVLKGRPEWVLPLGRRLGRLFAQKGPCADRTRSIAYAVIYDFAESILCIAIISWVLSRGFR